MISLKLNLYCALDWMTISGPTPSSGTGPIVGHTSGTPSDRYMYVEASNGRDGDMATLVIYYVYILF